MAIRTRAASRSPAATSSATTAGSRGRRTGRAWPSRSRTILGQVKALVPDFDFAIVEECFQYRECGKAVPFIAAGKAVLEVEYKLDRSDFCSKALALGYSSRKKRHSLGPWRRACS